MTSYLKLRKKWRALSLKKSRNKWMFPKIVGFPPKSSILIGFSILNHPFWGTPIFGNTQIEGHLHFYVMMKVSSASVQLFVNWDSN